MSIPPDQTEPYDNPPLEKMPSQPDTELSSDFPGPSPVASGELGQCLGCLYDAPKQLETSPSDCRFKLNFQTGGQEGVRIRPLYYQHARRVDIKIKAGETVGWDQRDKYQIINFEDFIEVECEEQALFLRINMGHSAKRQRTETGTKRLDPISNDDVSLYSHVILALMN